MKHSSPRHRYTLFVYFLLAFAISWVLIVILAKPGNIPIDPEASGDILPFLYVAMLFGPSLAGLFMTLLAGGKAGRADMGSRLVRWRVHGKWYALALFAVPVSVSLILLLLSVFDPGFRMVWFQSGQVGSSLLGGIGIGLMVGLFEELGWTGFAIPRMLRRWSVLATGVLVGVLWGAWHFILFWEADSFAGALPFSLLIARLLGWLPPFRVLMVWIYSRTRSLLVVVLMHMSLVVATTVLVPMTLAGKELLIWLVTWSGALWVVVAVLYLRRSLGMADSE